ncbi:MAG: type II toxin-antitoxin system VapC family toxin [Deltaproteobacteria bacterium]|nr:type II toxin-antitoxin system VapC family toxin [Deltaproteobacteria bacterium]
MKYLIDTDWTIHYLNGKQSIVDQLIALRKEGLAISVISLAEVYEGVYYSREPKSSQEGLNNFLKLVSVLQDSDEIAKIFGKVRGGLRKKGELIDDFDLMIASTAIHYNLTILTNNRKHFERVEGLKIISN